MTDFAEPRPARLLSGETWIRGLRDHIRLAEQIYLHNPVIVSMLFLLVALAVRIGDTPPYKGDGSEYFLMTRSLALDGDWVIHPAEAAIFQIPESPWQAVRIAPGGYPLMKGADGLERCLHSPVVPAIVAPFFRLCDRIAGPAGGFRAFPVFGLWAILTCWYLLARYWESTARLAAGERRRWVSRFLSGLVVIFSPISIYSYWTHPEAGVFLLLCAFFFALHFGWYVLAAIFLGLASAHSPVCIFWAALFAPELIRVWRGSESFEDRRSRIGRLFAAMAVAPLPAILLAAYSYRLYGTPSLLPRFGSGWIALISPERTARFYFDPFIGLLWFYPWILLAFFSTGAWRTVLLRLLISLPIAALSTAVTNLHSEMIGLRYLVFVYPAFLFIPFRMPEGRPRQVAVAGLAAVCLYMTMPFVFSRDRSARYLDMLGNEAYVGLSAVTRWLPALYVPHPECFVENALHADGQRAPAREERVSPYCSYVFVTDEALAPGKATLLLRGRGRHASERFPNADFSRAGFCVNRRLTFVEYPIEQREDHYRMEFLFDSADYLREPLWPRFAFLKFNHPVLEPYALQLPDGRTYNLQ